MRTLSALLGLCLAISGARAESPSPVVVAATATASAASAADTAAIRAAIQKGLVFLEKEGVQWHEEKGCLSCHHIPFMAWTHREAQRHGIPVDAKKLEQWIAWCGEWAEPKGGNDVLAELMLFLPKEIVPAGDPKKKLEAVPAKLAGFQKADGSWTASGQFHAQQWPTTEANEVTSMLMLQALNTSWGADAEKSKAAREKGLAWLKGTQKPSYEGTNSYTMRLLAGQRLGDAGRQDALCEALISQQEADGGWSWKVALEGSDPIATGEVLFVLNATGRKDAAIAEAQRRAVANLLKIQREDGAWFQTHKRISKKMRKEEAPKVDGIYTYWSTAWATLGLLSTLPEAAVAEVTYKVATP